MGVLNEKRCKKAWSTLTSSEKKDYDIPKTKFTCDQYIKELNEVFDNKIENTWQMTWDVVEIWDTNKSHTIPPNNTGIEGATEGEVMRCRGRELILINARRTDALKVRRLGGLR